MPTSTQYRWIAEQQRRAAAECKLGLVRELRLASAARFEILADEASRSEGANQGQPRQELFY